MIDFLRPTLPRLVFVVEWSLFVLLSAMRGDLESGHEVLVALYPLAFFYLVGCTLAAWSRRRHRVAQGRRLLVIAAGLVLLDQAIKTLVVRFIPHQMSLPIVTNWLHVAHERNVHGSWIAALLQVEPSTLLLVQWGVAIPVFFLSALCYRYYTITHRRSLWADVTFVGLLAGYASWMSDISLRGYVVDWIHLPGLVTADLKDLLLTLGAAALFVEALDNPGLSWRWEGWQKETEDGIRLLKGLYRFGSQWVLGRPGEDNG